MALASRRTPPSPLPTEITRPSPGEPAFCATRAICSGQDVGTAVRTWPLSGLCGGRRAGRRASSLSRPLRRGQTACTGLALLSSCACSPAGPCHALLQPRDLRFLAFQKLFGPLPSGSPGLAGGLDLLAAASAFQLSREFRLAIAT